MNMGKIEIPWAAGYFAYRDGRVQSPSGNFLKPQKIDQRGYFCVWPASKRVRLHRLVATLFIENPSEYTEVNHKDGDKGNNSAENLEWVSRTQNMRHAMESGLKRVFCGESSPHSKLTDEQVSEIRKLHKPRDKQFSATALGRLFGCTPTHILRIVNNEMRA